MSGGRAIRRWIEAALVETNLLVALAVVALHRFVVLHLGLDVPVATDLVIGGSTLALYSVDRLFDRAVEGERSATRSPLRGGVTAAIGVVVAIVGLVAAPPAVRALVVVGALVSTTYGLPVRRREGVRRWVRLKDLPGVKSWMVAAAVSVAVVSVPVVWSAAPVDARVVVTTAMLFALTAANAHLFDLRDVAWDRRLEVPTVPVRWGVGTARALIVALLLAAMASAAVDAATVAGPTGLGVVVAALAVVPLAWRGSPATPALAWPLVVDGALVLPWLVASLVG